MSAGAQRCRIYFRAFLVCVSPLPGFPHYQLCVCIDFLFFGITDSLGSSVIPCRMSCKTRPVSACRRRFLSAPAPNERRRSRVPDLLSGIPCLRLTVARLPAIPALCFHRFLFLWDYGLAALVRDSVQDVLQNPAGFRLAAALFISAGS